MPITYGSNIVRDNLVFYVDARNPRSYSGSGTVWKDLFGNGNNVNLIGPTFQQDTFSFDGVDDYGWIENLIYNSSNTLEELSVFAWFNTTVDAPGYDANWSFIDFDRSNIFNFYLRGDGKIGMSGLTNNQGGISIDQYFDIMGNNTYNDGEWHYVGWTYSVSQQEIVMYGDGEIDKTFVADGNLGPLGTNSGNRSGVVGDGSEFGSPGTGNLKEKFYEGEMTILQMYEKTLTYSEYLKNYNASRRSFGK